jgi:hypothetical protein
MGNILLMSMSNIWLSLNQFLQNSHLPISIVQRSSVPNIIQICQEMWKVQVGILLHLEVNYDCHKANFHETCACIITFCKEFSYQPSLKSDKQCSH